MSFSADAACFFTLAGVSLSLVLASLRSAARRRAGEAEAGGSVGFVLAPVLALALGYENLALGVAASAAADSSSSSP